MTFKMTTRRRLVISLLPLLLLILDLAHSSSPQLNTINNAAGLEGLKEDSILIKSRYLEKDTKGNETDNNNNSNPNDGQDQATEKPEETEKKGSEAACLAAKSCPDCVEAAKTFASDSENTCAWQIGDSGIECLLVKKEDVKDQEGDLCAKDEKDTQTDTPTKDTASNNTDETEKKNQVKPTHNDYGEEGNGGAIFALLLMFLFAGGIYYNKDKILQATAGLETLMQEQSGGTSSSKGKYQNLSVEEDDEEWGWGDDNADSTGDVELHPRGSTYKDQALMASPTITKTVSPAPPSSGGLSIPSSNRSTSGGSLPKSGMTLGKRPSGSPTTTPSPAVPSSMPLPQRVTSLGKKKSPKAKPKKAVAPAEDDIFASMGLSAKPTFSHTPSPATSKTTATSISGSRWAVSPSPATFPTTAAAPPTTTSYSLSATVNDDDADWGDDADLDDLLDD